MRERRHARAPSTAPGAGSAASASRTRSSGARRARATRAPRAAPSGRCVLPSKKNMSSSTSSASRERRLDVAELHRDALVDVAVVAVVVQAARPRCAIASRRVEHRLERLVLDLDRAGSPRRRSPRRRAATAATGSPTKRTWSRHSACSSWETGRMPNGIGSAAPVSTATHARHRLGRADVSMRDDARVGDVAAQELAVQHARQRRGRRRSASAR